MFTYQLRQRGFRALDGDSLEFPNSVELVITLGPLQPFGVSPDGGRTAVMGGKVDFLYNANTGTHDVISHNPLSPLEVTIEEPNRRWVLQGNVLSLVIDKCESAEELAQLISGLYYSLPILLNVVFADPPVIDQIQGKVGGRRFNWELAKGNFGFRTTTQDSQEEKFNISLDRSELLSVPGNSRLLGALQYFYLASRLRNAGHSPWEFTAEILLSLSKTLETLFPPSGDGQTRDAVREGLALLGYSADEIERKFLPAMALRNEIDVGHVDLSLYTRPQLNALHNYTDSANTAWSDMLQTLMNKIADGNYVLPQHVPSSADSVAAQVIERIELNFGDDVYRQS